MARMMWRAPRNLAQCYSIEDLRALAQRRVPHPIFHYLDGAAETELSAERNTSAFDALQLVPKCLVDVTHVKTATRVLGQDTAWPLLCSPTGASRLIHADGEPAVARAAAKAGAYYGLACMSTTSLEAVAVESAGPKLFQLYVFKDRDVTRDMIARCKTAGYQALCLTVDTAVPGKRERDLRTGMKMPPRLSLRMIASFARRPAWVLGQARHGAMTLPNVANRTARNSFTQQSQYFGAQLDPSVTWKDAAEMISQWSGAFAIKGILSAEDARRAADVGATAVIVSNHGGRQLDGAVSPIEVLPEIVDAVGDRIEVILDSGVRRGVHILKALALGARACSIGRPYLYGLGAGGEAGVTKALELLRSELVRAMQLCGCTDVRSIDPGLLRAS